MIWGKVSAPLWGKVGSPTRVTWREARVKTVCNSDAKLIPAVIAPSPKLDRCSATVTPKSLEQVCIYSKNHSHTTATDTGAPRGLEALNQMG